MEKPDSVPKSTKRRIKRQLNSQKNKLEPLPVPQYTMGAGNDLGLSLILHSQVDKYFLTSGTFEGFKVSTTVRYKRYVNNLPWPKSTPMYSKNPVSNILLEFQCSTMFENHQKWSHLNFSILAFSTNFWSYYKVTQVTLFECHFQLCKHSPNWTIFVNFKCKLSFEWDFLGDFQTL